MLARKPDRELLTWPHARKLAAMQTWSQLVMTDQRVSKAEIRVAWALSYSFNSDTGRNWETKAKLAKRAGLSESGVKAALTDLDQHGHIIRTTEVIKGKEMRVIRPSMSRQLGIPKPRPRRGGVAKGVDPRALAEERRRTDVQSPQGTDIQAPGGTDLQAPCILESSGINPRVGVAGVRTTRELIPDDDWEDDTIEL